MAGANPQYVSVDNRCVVKSDLLCFEEGQICQDFVVFDCSKETIDELKAKTPEEMIDPFVEPEFDDDGNLIVTLTGREITFGQDEKRCIVARVCWTGGGGSTSGSTAKGSSCNISSTSTPSSYGIEATCTKSLGLPSFGLPIQIYVTTTNGPSSELGDRGFSRNGQEVACDRSSGAMNICKDLCIPKSYLEEMVPINLSEDGINTVARRKDCWQLLVGKTNDAPFGGYGVGQLQFDSANIRENPDNDDECIVQFCFLVDWPSVVTYPFVTVSATANTDVCGCGGSTPIPITVCSDVSMNREPWDCVSVDTYVTESVGASGAGEIAAIILALLFGLTPCIINKTVARSMCISRVAEREPFGVHFPPELDPLYQH